MLRSCSLLCAVALIGFAADKADKKPTAPATPKAGIKTPGVQIPIASLKPEAQIETAPAWIGIADVLLIPNTSTGALDRLDPKTNKLDKPVPGVNKTCGGTITAFSSVWVATCGDQSVLRIDPKKWEITATIASGAGVAHQSIAASTDSVWVFTDNLTTLSRIDPDVNRVVGELRLPAGCTMLAFGETVAVGDVPIRRPRAAHQSANQSCREAHRSRETPRSRLRSAKARFGCCAKRKARSIASIPRPTRSPSRSSSKCPLQRAASRSARAPCG